MFGLTEYHTFPFLLRESVFLLRQGTDDAGQSHWRSTNTGNNVRRFTRAAMLMVNKLPQEYLADVQTILGSQGPSRSSLRSRN